MSTNSNQTVASKKALKNAKTSSMKVVLWHNIMRSKKRLVRSGLVFANILLLTGVVWFVSTAPSLRQTISTDNINSAPAEVLGPLDQLSSVDIAVNVARMVSLPQTASVTNLADSVNAQLISAQSDEQSTTKPIIASAPLPSKKDIREYVVQSGDTISTIAEKFNVSSDSVKWSNNLVGSTVPVGTTLYIPPSGVEGIVYVVEAGDTPQSLADEFSAKKNLIIAFNDAEVDGLKPGERILIPGGEIEVPEPVYNFYAANVFGPSAQLGYNGYDYGWCTWYTANRRKEIGRPVPGNLGHAAYWYGNARAQGIATGTIPQPGAVAMTSSVGWGHVAVVEQVNADGSFWISEMNAYGQVGINDPTPTGGWSVRNFRLIQSVGNTKFIY
jgi:N-acetylmuramoyl-L-alanine amidase